VVVVAAALVTTWLPARERTLPVHPGPTTSAADLCAEPAPMVSLEFIDPTQYSSAALCPADARAPEWASLPTRPWLVEGQALRLIAVSFGGPPIELCEPPDAFPDGFPDYRIVVAPRRGGALTVPAVGLRCDGRFTARSFYSAMAEQELAKGLVSSGPGAAGMCAPPWEDRGLAVPFDPPPELDVDEVVLCVHPALAPSRVSAVPQYRPVVPTRVTGAEAAQLADDLRATEPTRSSPRASCPYENSYVEARVRAGSRVAGTVLACETTYQDGVEGARWLAVPPRSRDIVLDAIARAEVE
jgi:hypothetical protein